MIYSRSCHEAKPRIFPFHSFLGPFGNDSSPRFGGVVHRLVRFCDTDLAGHCVTKSGLTDEVRIPVILGSEKIARDRSASFAAAVGFREDRIEDIKTAVSEASLNAIEHAAPGDPLDEVVVQFSGDQDGMQIAVMNKGVPFVPKDVRPDIKDKIEGKDRPRGWGLFLIQELADEVEFSSENNVTTVTMRFFL